MIYNPIYIRLARHFIWTCLGIISLWMITLGFPDEASALLVILVTAGATLLIFRHFSDEKEFITTLFLAALTARLIFGIFIHIYDLRSFFGGDALTFDANGAVIADHWQGLVNSRDIMYQRASMTSRPGWGINYLVAAIYWVLGRNILAAQSFCAVVGAATAPMVYFCAEKVFENRNVAKTASFAVAFFPAFIIWSGQLLKDGLIVFLLVLVMTMVLQLQERISYVAIALLVLSLFGIIALRFYIFYMVAVAVGGSLLVGLSNKSTSILRRAGVLIVIGLGLTYLGVTRNATSDFERYADLDRLQNSRLDMARSAESGFSEDSDISTTGGAISAIPIGFAYLMFAPFPWQLSSIRQAISFPEVLLWWAMMPLLVGGTVYAIRHRLRSAFPILFFSVMLTLAYSVFQGNVGTAYRQRTQIQVFLFIFIAVGWELWRERREDQRTERLIKQRQFEQRLQAGSSNF
jgi:4-amino-4-deoxy-L-arabinose transferase-like glycosyltransferase